MSNPRVIDPQFPDADNLTGSASAPAYTRGLQPREALLGLACRGGFATLAGSAPAHSGLSDDFLLPQSAAGWTNAWLLQLGTAPNN